MKRGFLIVITSFVLSVLLFTFVLIVAYVPTESMEPTVKAGTVSAGIRLVKEYKKGDIVVFRYPGSKELFVKRIVAVGGEEYTCEDPVTGEERTWTVPEGKFFVRGDNAERSYDSRYWDNPFVDRSDIVAKLFLVFGGESEKTVNSEENVIENG